MTARENISRRTLSRASVGLFISFFRPERHRDKRVLSYLFPLSNLTSEKSPHHDQPWESHHRVIGSISRQCYCRLLWASCKYFSRSSGVNSRGSSLRASSISSSKGLNATRG